MGGVHILDFPTEILAKVFQEVDVETAWNARGVCRYWYEVFEMVAYGSTNSPFTGLQIEVEAICGMKSSKGELLDSHVLHSDLSLMRTSPADTTSMVKWSSKKKRYEYWPGGSWRNYSLVDVLTDIRLRISGIPFRDQPLLFPLGIDVGLQGNVICEGRVSSSYEQLGQGRFRDFVVNIDTVEESSRCGRINQKHSVKGVTAPKWQFYGLLVEFIRKEREITTRRRRHFSISHQRIVFPEIRKSTRSQSIAGLPSCGQFNGWTQLPPRWEVGWIEC